MRLADNLRQIAAGERPNDDWLLGTCALTTTGGDVYGEEAIVAAFRDRPLALGASVVRSERGIARFGDGVALFADVHDGHVARLWQVGGAGGEAAQRRVAVAFDPDLAQRRGDLVIDPGALDVDAAGLDRVRILLASLVRDRDATASRRRGFVIRAFADERATAVLIAMYTAAAGGIGFHHVAVVVGDDQTTIVVDRPATGPWLPRL